MTIQNEPQSVQTWESCIYDADMAHDFIKNYMGPTLEKNQMQDCRIIAWDHNRDFAYHYVADMLNDPETAKYIWGVGFHWYDRGKYENIDQVKRASRIRNWRSPKGVENGSILKRFTVQT